MNAFDMNGLVQIAPQSGVILPELFFIIILMLVLLIPTS